MIRGAFQTSVSEDEPDRPSRERDGSINSQQGGLPRQTVDVAKLRINSLSVAPIAKGERPRALSCRVSHLMERGFKASRSQHTPLIDCGTQQRREAKMRKLSLALAVSALTIGAFVAWSAQAAPLILLPSQNQLEVQQVGCTAAGSRCPFGRTWVCAPRGCSCAPCGVYYGAPWRYPVRPWRWRY